MPEQLAQPRFRRLQIHDWRQFAEVDVNFHPRLTVLTGANGSGKTTLLYVLGRHFNAWTQLLGVPYPDKTGNTGWSADSQGNLVGRPVGTLTYETADGDFSTPVQVNPGAQYEVELINQRVLRGIYIPSHRQATSYQQLTQIPTSFSSSSVILDQYVSEIYSRSSGGGGSGRATVSLMKEALITAGLYGPGNSVVEPNQEAQAVWFGFQEVLGKMLPASLGFRRLVVRMPNLLIATETDEFLIEAMSGGISAIMELTWQIYLRSREFAQFTVCIDEPENHLHPSLQRALLPGLLQAFPHISFVVSTHSPFIVTAVPESNVYALDYVDGRVHSRLLDYASKAASSDETLRRVLGLETTIPVWVEERLAEALAEFPVEDASTDDLRRLHSAMESVGLRDEFPAAVDSLIRTSREEE